MAIIKCVHAYMIYWLSSYISIPYRMKFVECCRTLSMIVYDYYCCHVENYVRWPFYMNSIFVMYVNKSSVLSHWLEWKWLALENVLKLSEWWSNIFDNLATVSSKITWKKSCGRCSRNFLYLGELPLEKMSPNRFHSPTLPS